MDSRTSSGRLLGDRYELNRRIGTGGMAEVWEATDRSLGRQVAIKLLHIHLAEDHSILARFRTEAQSAARLTHPGIVAIYDTVSTPDTDAIVMELVHGRDLRSILDERGTLAVDDALEVAAQVAQALGHAHHHGIIHRDVKPANILVRPDRRVKLSDFGIAKALGDTTFTDSGSLVGTVKYLAPEQIQGGPVDGRTDLYALTTVLFEMLCGEVPFGAQDLVGSMERVRRDAPRARSKRSDLPRAIDDFLAAGLARRPDDRPADAATYAASLMALRRGDDTVVRPAGPAPLVAAPTPTPTPTPPARSPAAPPSIPMRAAPATSPSPARHVRPHRRSRLQLLWPLFAALLMIAALVTVWLLLKPAGDSVSDTIRGSTTTSTPGTTTGPSDDAPATSTTDPVEPTDPESSTTTSTTSTTVPFTDGVRSSAFDPFGDGAEHGDIASRALDDDPESFWYTERYATRRFGALKSGVGFVVEFAEPTTVGRLRTSTDHGGWSAEIYLANQPRDSLDAWGEPVAVLDAVEPRAEVTFEPVTTGALLLWITDLGDGEEPIRLELYELDIAS